MRTNASLVLRMKEDVMLEEPVLSVQSGLGLMENWLDFYVHVQETE